jgi:Flp pilus assembly protein TadD
MPAAIAHPRTRPQRRDRRVVALVATLALVAAGGWVMQSRDVVHAPTAAEAQGRIDPAVDASGHAAQRRTAEVELRFKQAVVMLHARQHEHAATALHRVLELAPQMPEAHVNMGFALMGVGRAAAARDFFEGALALHAEQANAYYGLAIAHEALGDLEAAVGAMRTYLHRAKGDDAAHRRRAEAALWEWDERLRQSRLGPGPRPAAVPAR